MVKSAISRKNRDSVPIPRVVLVPLMQRQNGTGTIQSGTGTTWMVPVPLTRTKVVPIPRQSGTSTNFQNMIGTGTNPSGTGTTASSSPDFCICALLSSNSYTKGIGTLINQ